MITSENFNSALPEIFKGYIDVGSLDLPDTYGNLLASFNVAMGCLKDRIRIVSPLQVVVSKAPFVIQLSNGSLQYNPHSSEIINVHIDNRIIFLDAEKMFSYPQELQVAAILEEFVHAVMNVSDEELVSRVVACLFTGIVVKDGRYCLPVHSSELLSPD